MMIVRPSEVKTFKRCRRQWEMRYVHEIGTDHGTDSSRVGTDVHKAAEVHYKGGDALLWLAQNVGDPAEYSLAEAIVSGYLEWLDETGADDGFVIEGVELELDVPWPNLIEGEEILLRGHIDLLATDHQGLRWLIDHKTVQSLEQYARQLSVDHQMLTYALMLRMLGTPVGGALHNAMRRVKRTAAAKPPFYQRNRVTYSEAHLDSHFDQLEAVFSDMVTCRRRALEGDRRKLYPSPSKDCTWDCPHLSLCPSFDDGSPIDTIIQLMKKEAR